MSTRCLARATAWLLATGLALPSAAQFSIIGISRLPSSGPTCSAPLGPAQGELFAVGVGTGGTEVSSTTEWCINGTVDLTYVDWRQGTGAWQVTDRSQVLAPGGWTVTVTAYPDRAVSPITEHRGLVLFDYEGSRTGSDGWLHANTAEEIGTPLVRPSPGINDVAWAPLSTGSGVDCEHGPSSPVVMQVGWDVYRLLRSVVPPATSTPDHYLCGPDLDCATTADNGFVAFVSDVPGVDGLVHYRDAVPADPALADYVYVVQPVKPGAPTGDANGDTIADEDLDGNTIPEFVDPSLTGRGLTARIEVGPTYRKPILISPDSVTVSDVLIFIEETAPGGIYQVRWNALGGGMSSSGHDFHRGSISDIRNPVAFAARERVACDWPDGPAARPITSPRFEGSSYYYLMSVAYPAGGSYVDEYGTDSFGVEHPATTTLPACR